MEIFLYLCKKFFEEQKTTILVLIFISLIISFVYTNLTSRINANIIQGVQTKDFTKVFSNYHFFIGICIAFIVLQYFFKSMQNKLMTILAHWSKSEIFNFILLANNENMRNVNFVEFITPITRVSNSSNMLLADIISNVIPTATFLVVIIAYFLYKDIPLGIGFLLGNVLILAYLLYFWKDIYEYKKQQEFKTVENERYIIDSFNNIDKIIYRGQVKNEMNGFKEKTDECVNFTTRMLKYVTNHTFVMTVFVYIIILLSIYHMIRLNSKNRMETVTFITFLSILMMYRDDISSTIQRIPMYLESAGRISLIVKEFDDMIGEKNREAVFNAFTKNNDIYQNVDLLFDTIHFENVSFAYDRNKSPVFQNYNKELYLRDKIIGITGLSGNGKSSFVKLIMRLHDCTDGTIYIDGQDIKTIDPYYIRQNITYVNQNSKLFNRKVIDNILYGCKDISACNENLREILSYSKIQELYRNVDIEKGDAGPLGENLSGGQRQVINIISGLINPTKILILDEPTNAIDPDLKRELLLILKNFRKYKKCIIIITHDRDVYSLFDETLEL